MKRLIGKMKVVDFDLVVSLLAGAVSVRDKLMKKRKRAVVRNINLIVIHCTATGDYPLGHLYFDRIGAKQIRQSHMASLESGGRNFDDIGYHFVVRRTGLLERGRPESVQGAHCYGSNEKSLGIAYVGTMKPTDGQIETMRLLLRDLMQKYHLTKDQIKPHCELNPHKLCPGFDIYKTLLWDFK